MRIQVLGAVALGERIGDPLCDGERLAGQHRGLVGHAHALEIAREVEISRHLVPERLLHLGDGGVALDEPAQELRFVHVTHDDVAATIVFRDLARGGLGLLVEVLAVDHRREALARVLLDPLPHVEHRAARRIHEHIHEHTAQIAQVLEVGVTHAEGRNENDVLRLHAGKIELPVLAGANDRHPHGLELLVHVGVVDDLPHQMDPLVGELGTALVGVLHGAVHAVAESEFPGQAECEIVYVERVATLADPVYQLAVVVLGEVALDLSLEAEALAEVRLLH